MKLELRGAALYRSKHLRIHEPIEGFGRLLAELP
jgi:hypothetical protein